MECKDRNNRSAITMPYSFLPQMAAKKLRDVADQVCWVEVNFFSVLMLKFVVVVYEARNLYLSFPELSLFFFFFLEPVTED